MLLAFYSCNLHHGVESFALFILSVGQPCKDPSIPCKLEIFIHGGRE